MEALKANSQLLRPVFQGQAMAQDDCAGEAPSEFEFDRGNEDLCEVGEAPRFAGPR